jgi:hypothetical protein
VCSSDLVEFKGKLYKAEKGAVLKVDRIEGWDYTNNRGCIRVAA